MVKPDIVRVPHDGEISLELERVGASYVIWACSDTVKHKISVLSLEEPAGIEDVIELVLQQEELPGVIRGWFS